MPRWDLHLSCGISVTVLYVFCAFFPIIQTGDRMIFQYLERVSLPLLIGAFSVLVGSILPDIDGKGRIRWIIGPVIGAFALALMTIKAYVNGGIDGGFSYLANDGALLFLAGTALGYGILILPMRHRGIMHRIPAAMVFSLLCAGSFILTIDMDPGRGALVAAMAFSGYGWHIALDGSA